MHAAYGRESPSHRSHAQREARNREPVRQVPVLNLLASGGGLLGWWRRGPLAACRSLTKWADPAQAKGVSRARSGSSRGFVGGTTESAQNIRCWLPGHN